MKPFDLEAAKRGEPVCDREGVVALQVEHFPKADAENRVIALWGEGHEVCSYSEIGGRHGCRCLFMAPKKRKGWVNIMFDGSKGKHRKLADIWDTEEAAKRAQELYPVLATVPIEWEE